MSIVGDNMRRAKKSPNAVALPLRLLRFDPHNPRITELIGSKPTQKQIHELLLGPSLQATELVPSFIENGYLPYEPLIVRPEKSGQFVVLEGNRRLAALLSLRDSDDPDEKQAFRRNKLDEVPCIVFDGDEKDELAYLGLRHLSKTKDWSPSAKAAFVERVLRTGRSLKDASRIINVAPPSIRTMLLTRRLFERAGQLGIDLPTAGTEQETAFWHLGDAIRRSNTKRFLEIEENDDPLQQPSINEAKFEQLLEWLYGSTKRRRSRLIQSIRDIPDLDRCVSHRRALAVLEGGGSLDDAKEELEVAGANVAAHLQRAKKSIQRARGLLSDVDSSGKREIKGIAIEVERALKDLLSAL